MKYLIVSDIHGCLPALEQVLQFYHRHHYDMLLILGDILNYGPRNGLPKGLNPKGIAEKLNEMAEQIVAIRGNCDSEVDQMLLDFPILSNYTLVVDEGRKLFLTHGHIYNEEKFPCLHPDIFFYGHTHLCKLEKNEQGIICNTGSITFPKGGNPPTFASYEQGKITLHHLNGEKIKELSI